MTADTSGRSELCELAVSLAQAAGQRLLSLRATDLVAENKTSGSDWVTNADRMVEAMVVELIHQAHPGDGILGEESTARRSETGWTWVIDPLDGTTNYLRGYPSWSVSIAVELDGVSVAGAVHDPNAALTYSAAAGRGATLNGRPVKVSDCAELARAVVGTGFSYTAEHRARQAEQLAGLLPVIADIRRAGSAALELCRVADGSLDAFYEDDLQYWDWAAGGLIVQEAGGVLQQLSGEGRSGVAAASPDLLPALLRARSGTPDVKQ